MLSLLKMICAGVHPSVEYCTVAYTPKAQAASMWGILGHVVMGHCSKLLLHFLSLS
jgi:hypothetical protein